MNERHVYATDDAKNCDSSVRIVGTTASGETQIVIRLATNGYYRVKYIGKGGVLPARLSGAYLTYADAERDVKQYVHEQTIDPPRIKKIKKPTESAE